MRCSFTTTWPSAEVSIIFHIHYYHIPKYDKLMHIYAFTLHQFVRRRFNAIPSSSQQQQYQQYQQCAPRMYGWLSYANSFVSLYLFVVVVFHSCSISLFFFSSQLSKIFVNAACINILLECLSYTIHVLHKQSEEYDKVSKRVRERVRKREKEKLYILASIVRINLCQLAQNAKLLRDMNTQRITAVTKIVTLCCFVCSSSREYRTKVNQTLIHTHIE